MIKAAFFDMDGTIVAPLFKPGNNVRIGFSGDEWPDFCNEYQKDAYDSVAPVIPVIGYARELRDAGCDTSILTITLSEGERTAKTAWLRRNPEHAAAFAKITFVRNGVEKIEHILDYAKTHGIRPSDCTLVEDDLLTLIKAVDTGIRCVHTSHIFAGVHKMI